MGDYSLCKHDTASGYCDICSPNWKDDLEKVDLIDTVYEKGIEKGRSEMEYKLQAMQAKIDALMLKYCPNEMTKEQLATWAFHQHISRCLSTKK